MTMIETRKDLESPTLTLVALFAATPEWVFALFEDLRKLEKWWGPPTGPATFTRHDLSIGGESRYHLTGPAGEVGRGYWQMLAIDKPNRIDFLTGLAGEDGEPVETVPPMTGFVTFEAVDGGTRLTVATRFVDLAQMETMLNMGMAEGMGQAIGQIDALLAPVSA